MPSTVSVPSRYRIALEELAAACREARDLADALEYAAALLRGRPPDPDGPLFDLAAAAGLLRRAMARLDDTRDAARDAWESLPAGEREELPPPEELLDQAGQP
jgi:hypothetical protein